jgi:hypothetical protein
LAFACGKSPDADQVPFLRQSRYGCLSADGAISIEQNGEGNLVQSRLPDVFLGNRRADGDHMVKRAWQWLERVQILHIFQKPYMAQTLNLEHPAGGQGDAGGSSMVYLQNVGAEFGYRQNQPQQSIVFANEPALVKIFLEVGKTADAALLKLKHEGVLGDKQQPAP